jgi:beta-ureidopropionase / N-carbamoyl-L-amino-acid hydrolase
MTPAAFGIDGPRLHQRIASLAELGAIEGGGVARLALTAEDKAGRDRVVAWMREQALEVSVDRIGNVFGVRAGSQDLAPVVIGSHIDTVRTGGRFDGNLGVLAGLEIVQTLDGLGMKTRRPVAVAFFTNEEGARFAPDMMGSMVHQGHLPLAEMLAVVGIDGVVLSDALAEIDYAGMHPCPGAVPHAFLELHVEQGPVLEREGVTIGAVTGVQGISWTEVVFDGVSNHAGTTPMAMRQDAGFGAAALAVFARNLATELSGAQVATVGAISLHPNLVNVIARRAQLTVDLRNTDEAVLCNAEQRLHSEIERICATEELSSTVRSLARFEPVQFDPKLIARVEHTAKALGHSVRRLPSGAGHDAQAFAPNCPTTMIFVPSIGGISHNVSEFTTQEHVEAGANVLLQMMLELANE